MSCREATFGALVSSSSLEIGDGYRAKNEELGGVGPIFLRAAYLQDSGFTLNQPDRFLTQDLAAFGQKVARLGDVVITTKGNSTGRVGRIREPQAGSIYSPHLSYWRTKQPDEIDQGFLFYWSQSPEFREQLGGMATSTDMAPYLSLRDQLRLRITLPPIKQQQVATLVLGALDDKIELNRRMNETLEAMARAIFKDWFVDFGPTRAKMEGRAPYLAPEIWSLFPDQLDDDGKPEGWRSTTLSEHVSVTKGKSYRSAELQHSKAALVTLKSFQRGGGYRRDGLKPFIGDYKAEQLVIEGEIIVAQTDVTQAADVIGRPARVISDARFERLIASLDVAIIRPNKSTFLQREFLLYLMGSEIFTQHTFSHTSGTTVLHLGRNAIPSFNFFAPTSALASAFEALVLPLASRQILNVHENDSLVRARDLLLPKLMSGEIRIKDAEKLVEAAA